MSALDAAAGATVDDRSLDERLFVISGNNSWVHIYPDAPSLLSCKDTVMADPGPLEFFDIHGCRLGPVVGNTWVVEGLRLTAEQPDESAVRDRLCAVIDSIKATMEQRLALEPNPPGGLDVALARLPDLKGKTLPECYALLDGANFGDPLRKDDGGFWHNLLCH